MIRESPGRKQGVGAAGDAPGAGGRLFRTLADHPAWVVFAIALAAVALRTVGTWRQVFAPDRVVLCEMDPWYHLRRIEHLSANFPHLMRHDPYALHPGGEDIFIAPMLDVVVVLIAKAVAGGAPSERTLATVAALVPPLCAAGLVVLAYATAAALFNRRAAVLAALLLPLMPGPLQRCTMLGFADHHALEALFSAGVLCCLVRALPGGAEEEGGGWFARRTRRWALAGGLALGAYLLSWIGGLMLLVLLSAWIVVAWPVHHWRGGSNQPLAACMIGLGMPAALAVLPLAGRFHWAREQLFAIGGLVLLTVVMTLAFPGGGPVRPSRRRARVMGGIVLVGVAAAAAAGYLWAQKAGHPLSWFLFNPQRLLVEEASPLYIRDARFSLAPAWETFTLTGALALLGWFALIVGTVRRYTPGRVLLLVWTLVLVAITLQQRRFAYYSTFPIVLLAAWAVDAIWRALARRRAGHAAEGRRTPAWAVVAGLVLLFAAPVVVSAPAAVTPSGPAPDWRVALDWLRTRTPEPFGDSIAYLAESASAAPSAYGVLSTWDRGYWILTLGRRLPCGNPTQAGAGRTAQYFVAETEQAAAELLDALGARYIMLDCTVPVWRERPGAFSIGKFQALARWAGVEPRRYLQLCTPPPGRGGQPLLVFYPEYYRTMAARLYTFQGRAFTPRGEAYAALLPDRGAVEAPQMRDLRRFADAAAADAFVAAHAGEGWCRIGLSPFESCVALAGLTRHRAVYGSPTAVAERDGAPIPYVQIYAYTEGAEPAVR